MKRFRIWGLTAALAAGLGGQASAAEPGEKTTLMKKLFTPTPAKTAGPAAKPGPVQITAPLAPEVLADALRAEQDAYLRRVSVCTELRRVAAERGDEALGRQADELERQSSALYNARVASLGVSRVKAPLPDSSPPGVASLAEPGASRVAANRLIAPAAPVAGSTAQVREVKP